MKNLFRRFISNGRENLISLTGLSLGMMVMILCLSYVVFENSYDRFQSKSDRIATVYTRHETSPGQSAMSTSIESGLKFYSERNVPEVKASSRVKSVTSKIETGENSFNAVRGYVADPELFGIFDFKVLSGSAASIEPGNIVLTESLAIKLFGRSNCYGETLTLYGNTDRSVAVVSGVVKDYPDNSNLEFEYIIPFPATGSSGSPEESEDVNLYILVNKKPDSFEGLKGALDQYFLTAGENHLSSEIIPLVKLHRYWETYLENRSSNKTIMIFLIVSLMVLFTSAANYVNIQYARGETRLREIGLRKVNGATRVSIVKSMVAESVFLVILSSVLGLILSDIFLGKFQELTSAPVSQFGPGLLWLQVLIVLITLLLGMITGIMTSLRYSGFNPAGLVKGSISIGQGNLLRKVVVGLQFFISGGLIAVILIFSIQLRHLRNADMGFDPENRILLPLSPGMDGRYELVREKLIAIPAIENVTGKGSGFGAVDMAFGMYKGAQTPENRLIAMAYIVEDDFFDTYGMKILEGKSFSEVSGRDSSLVIIDRYTAGVLELEEPVGHRFNAAGITMEIIGMVEDADFKALNSGRVPRFYSQLFDLCTEVTVKYRDDIRDVQPLLSDIGRELMTIDPDYHLDFTMLEDAIWHLYGKERDLYTIILICGVLAIALSLTGAYSMAAYMAERRIRQNSIRRVLGATAKSITVRSVMEIVWPVLIGVAVSWPFVKIITSRWMENFLSKAEPGLTPYILSLILVGVFAAVTVFSVARRSSLRNPADMLRQE